VRYKKYNKGLYSLTNKYGSPIVKIFYKNEKPGSSEIYIRFINNSYLRFGFIKTLRIISYGFDSKELFDYMGEK
jgi:hypothetical protein